MDKHSNRERADRFFRLHGNGRGRVAERGEGRRNVLHEECSKPPTHFASGVGNHDDCGRALLVSSVDAGPDVRDLGHSDGIDRIHWILPGVFDRQPDQPAQANAIGARAADINSSIATKILSNRISAHAARCNPS